MTSHNAIALLLKC